MKNSLRFLGLFLLVSSAASAASEGGMKFGLQGGLSISSLNAPSGFTSSNVTGFSLGIALDAGLNENISIRPEALFTQRGTAFVSGATGSITSRYNTIEIPVFVKVSLGEGIKPNFFAGPNFSFNISESLTAQAGGNVGAVTFNPRTVDIGLAVGLGVDIGPIFINGRYLMGLVDVDENGASWNSRGFLLLAGIHI